MHKKTEWLWKLIKARDYMVATDRDATLSINVRNPRSFDTITMLSAQYTAVKDFRDRLNDLLDEHEEACKQVFGTGLKARKGAKKK